MSSPVVSVIVPAYNAGRFIAQTLESVIAQCEGRWECVIVDDGSSDDTFAIASEFAAGDSRFRAVRTENGGPSAARNTGFRLSLSTTTYVTFMDSDDVWLPHALRRLLDSARSDPGSIGSHALAEMIDEQGAPLAPGTYSQRGRHRLGLVGRRLTALPSDAPTGYSVLINGNVLFPPGLVLARRSAYEAAGPFDEALTAAEDWDMLIKLSRHGHLAFADEVILLYRRHGENLGARSTVPQQAWLVRCKAFHSPANSPDQQRIARRGWRAYQAQLFGSRMREAWRQLLGGSFKGPARSVASAGASAARLVRGYPLPKVVEHPKTWR